MRGDEPVSTLPGIGPITQAWLEEAGIGTVADLRALGAAEAYCRHRSLDPRRVSLNAL